MRFKIKFVVAKGSKMGFAPYALKFGIEIEKSVVSEVA